MRYSSTTAFMSRGGTLWRSKTSVIGMRMGSSSGCNLAPKMKNPAPVKGRALGLPRYSAHLTLSDLGRPRVAHDRFHLILNTEFQFLESRFLQLFLVGQMGKCFQFVQFMGELRVLSGK